MPPTPVKEIHTSSRLWDWFGIGLSVLCLIHCLALPVVLTGLSVWVAVGLVHQWLAGLLLGAVVLAAVPGYRAHRRLGIPGLFVLGLAALIAALWWEDQLGEVGHTALTVVGGLVLIAAHTLNWRYRRCVHQAS